MQGFDPDEVSRLIRTRRSIFADDYCDKPVSREIIGVFESQFVVLILGRLVLFVFCIRGDAGERQLGTNPWQNRTLAISGAVLWMMVLSSPF